MTDDSAQKILDSLEDHVAVVDRNGTIIATNEAWKKFSHDNGGTRSEVDVGCNYFEVCRRASACGDEIAFQALSGIEAVLAGRLEKSELEYPCHSPTERRWYILRVTPLSGAHQAAVVSHIDITRRRNAEEAQGHLLRQVEIERARLKAILQNTANAIIAIDARTAQVRANWEAEKLFGHRFVPACGRTQFVDQIRGPQRERIPECTLLDNLVLQGQTPPRLEVLVIRPDGSQTPCLASAAPIRGSGDTIDGVVLALEDISVLKELERQREEWTSLIAHDLRQPITIISGYVERLLRRSGLSADQQRSSLANIARSAEQLNRMIADLLDVSRIETRRLTLNLELVDLAVLTQQIVDRLQHTFPERALRFFVAGAIPRLWSDPDRIEQVLTNLVTNAAKYGYPKTEIIVELRVTAHEAVVSVTNRGPGIPPRELPRLFTRFFRTCDAKNGRQPGLGLGLYIAKGLIESHGGRVWVESIPEKTTTFYFTLPLSDEPSVH